jgi:hypothetical protein
MVLPRPGVELAFPGRNDALRVHAGAQVHERGGGLGIPAMLICARPLNEHRLADCLCKQGGIGGGVFMTVAVADSASLRAPIEEPRIADPDPIPRGGLHRRLRGGARCVAWQGRRRAFGLDRRASQEAWSEEHTRWSKRDLSAKRYVYFWVDGIHVQARLEDDAQCLLVIIGATPEYPLRRPSQSGSATRVARQPRCDR